jgi:large subunit ribosomal protein L4
MKLSVTDIKGNKLDDLEVKFQVIENGKGSQAVHEAVTAYRAAQRSGTACTKTAGEVAGTNKKPWRQKGTGRARAGSFQSPLWVGGGVVFGPKPRDFSKKVSKSTKRLALRKALSARLVAGDVVLVDDLKLDSHKTKAFLGLLGELKVAGSTLIITPAVERNLQLASRNVPKVEITTSSELSSYQVLRYDKLVFTRGAFEQVEQRLAS